MEIVDKIAYHIDKDNGIFIFGISGPEEYNYNFILKNIIKEIKIKSFIKINIDDSKDFDNLDIKNSIIEIDYDNIAFGKNFSKTYSNTSLFINKLIELSNNNSIILKKYVNRYMDVSVGRMNTISPISLAYSSNFVSIIENNILYIEKNRYFQDNSKYNILGYLREDKINKILND